MRILIKRSARNPNNPDEWTNYEAEKIPNEWEKEFITGYYNQNMRLSTAILKWEALIFEFDFESNEFLFLFQCSGQKAPKRILNAN